MAQSRTRKRKTSGPGSFPEDPTFDAARADRAVRFINNLTHTKDQWAGQSFALRLWQERIIRELFGRMRADDASRRAYRTCYIEVPRKNGKSELAAAIALYGLVGDGVYGAEVYSAAADREQAALVFNVAAQMVRNDPVLSARLKIIDSQKRIVDYQTGSFYRAISAEAYSKHGFNASLIIYDELHAAPNRELWDVLTTSQGARREPLTVAITTAGYDRNSICWEMHDWAVKVLHGQYDPSFYPVVYSAPEDADWTDENVWRAANPALEDFRDIEEMRAMAHRAKEIPASQNTFRRLYLNQWTEQSERWIDMAAWDRCSGSVSDEALVGVPCYGGLDLSTTTDLSAFVLVFDVDGDYVIRPYFWCPADNVERRSLRDRVPYQDWQRKGVLKATSGNVVDYDVIRADVNALAKQFRIVELGYDPWNSTQLATQLTGDGLRMVEIRQGFRTMNEPTSQLSALVLERRLLHGAHPVLRWMAGNMVVTQDPAGNIKPDKAKASERIDGMVALVMALSRAIVQPAQTGSIYERRGMVSVGS